MKYILLVVIGISGVMFAHGWYKTNMTGDALRVRQSPPVQLATISCADGYSINILSDDYYYSARWDWSGQGPRTTRFPIIQFMRGSDVAFEVPNENGVTALRLDPESLPQELRTLDSQDYTLSMKRLSLASTLNDKERTAMVQCFLKNQKDVERHIAFFSFDPYVRVDLFVPKVPLDLSKGPVLP